MESAIQTLVSVFLKSTKGKEGLGSKQFQKLVESQLGNILTGTESSEAIKEMRQGLDTNQDGKVNFEEYMKLVGYCAVSLSEQRALDNTKVDQNSAAGQVAQSPTATAEAKADANAEAKEESKPEAKEEATPLAKEEATPEAKEEPKADAKVEVSAEANVEPKVEVKVEEKAEGETQPVETKVEDVPAAVAAAAVEAVPAAAAAVVPAAAVAAPEAVVAAAEAVAAAAEEVKEPEKVEEAGKVEEKPAEDAT